MGYPAALIVFYAHTDAGEAANVVWIGRVDIGRRRGAAVQEGVDRVAFLGAANATEDNGEQGLGGGGIAGRIALPVRGDRRREVIAYAPRIAGERSPIVV